MSTITLFYGQCGNQISEALYSNICEDIANVRKDCDYYTHSVNQWFNVSKNKWIPRSILIDTELKTVPPKSSQYSFKNVVSKSCGGSANNWAFGYFEQSRVLEREIKDCIRKELEKSDLRSSFLNVFSSSGGTGSGVGSCIIEYLKNEFPNRKVVNALVMPYSTGELAIQSYNTLLVLAKIYSCSDAFILFENDRLHYCCANSLNIKNVNFSDINNLLAKQLLSVYQPLKDVYSPDLVTGLCEEAFKFLQIRLAPSSRLESAANWQSLLTSLSRQSRFDFQQKNGLKGHPKTSNLATALVSRGAHKPPEQALKKFKTLHVCKKFDSYYDRHKLFNLVNCVSVVSNSNNVFVPLNSIFQDAFNLFKYGAYLHHYEKYGVDKTHFRSSFEIVEKILRDYKNL